MASDYIHLGKKLDAPKEAAVKLSNKTYYPTAYIAGVEGMDVEDGDEVIMKGKVKSCTTSSRNGKKDYSCDIDVTHLKVVNPKSSSDGLDSALSKIEKKKQDASEETDETDSPEEEKAEGE